MCTPHTAGLGEVCRRACSLEVEGGLWLSKNTGCNLSIPLCSTGVLLAKARVPEPSDTSLKLWINTGNRFALWTGEELLLIGIQKFLWPEIPVPDPESNWNGLHRLKGVFDYCVSYFWWREHVVPREQGGAQTWRRHSQLSCASVCWVRFWQGKQMLGAWSNAPNQMCSSLPLFQFTEQENGLSSH